MDVIMPQLGETVAEGVVTRWHKKVGEEIRADEVLFDVETDKVSTEIPAPASGVIAEILVEEGVSAKVGERLAVIREAASAREPRRAAAPATEGAGAQRLVPTAPHVDEIVKPPVVPKSGAQGPLSPVVRKLVAEHGLDPRDITGTGRDGRITREDVTAHIANRSVQTRPATREAPAEIAQRRAPASQEHAREAPPARTGGEQAIELNALRKRVAQNMARAWSSVPHVLQVVEADFYRIEEARREHGAAWKAREGSSLTYLPFVVRAVSIGLNRYPKLNASFSDGRIVLKRRINIGIAVDVNFDGLIVPVVKDVPAKSLPQLARELSDLAARARAGKLKPDELTEGTYTITNNGAFGTVITAPIINEPQVAILSMDSVRKKPVVVEGPQGDAIAIRPVGVLAQSFDHRAVDGAYAAAFLREVKLLIETRLWTQDLQA
jgi:pyruvate dehydrogenase E2 component (dihydrolipoamide acetyltransferase)